MTKFQRIQIISSIIPFWSTIFVAVATMIKLKRRVASTKIWLYFVLTFFLSGISVYFLNTVIMTGKHPLLNIIASGLILTVTNVLFVDFQIMCDQIERPKATKTHSMQLAICCTIAMIICIVVSLFSLLSPSVNIEDINGRENTKLGLIKMDEIISTNNHYSAFSSHTLKTGSCTNVTGRLKDYDYQECSFSCKKISGIMTLQATKTTCKHITLEISSQLEEGNMEIVIVIDGEYYSHIPINQNNLIALSDIAGKTVVVKVAAESAKLSVSVKRLE